MRRSAAREKGAVTGFMTLDPYRVESMCLVDGSVRHQFEVVHTQTVQVNIWAHPGVVLHRQHSLGPCDHASPLQIDKETPITLQSPH
jgi:hypothetical protein